MATFVLIHGAGDVGWYWHLVAAELRERGHDTVAPDLPCDDVSAGLPEYADTVAAAAGDRSDLVVVAQSLGADGRRPIRTVVEVAKLAEVARSTIYTVFGSRAGPFDALGMDLLHRGGFTGMIHAVTPPDARQGLRDGIRGNVNMYAAHRDVLRALFSMAQLDADAVGGAVQRLEQGRGEGMNGLARRLHQQRTLRDDITADQATDVLWLLTGFDSFDLLFTGRQLSIDAVTATLADTAESALCRPVPDTPANRTGV